MDTESINTTGPGDGWVLLDGGEGEGGGQMLRTALSLSLVTGRPFGLRAVRAGRSKPGLQRQHLACVEAAAEIGSARVEGGFLGSTEVRFEPGSVRSGSFRFRIGGAGSATLLFQTVLPALARLPEASEVVVEGGTHNPFAPPFPFLAEAFLPLVGRTGWRVSAELLRPGFFPVGGGAFRVAITPCETSSPLVVGDGTQGSTVITAWVCGVGLPSRVADRAQRRILSLWGDAVLFAEPFPVAAEKALGTGFSLHLGVEGDGFRNVFSAFGTQGVPVERVVDEVVEDLQGFLGSGMAVEEHLADQLLLPMVLGAGGSFTATCGKSAHLATQVEVIRRFLGPRVVQSGLGDGRVRLEVVGVGI